MKGNNWPFSHSPTFRRTKIWQQLERVAAMKRLPLEFVPSEQRSMLSRMPQSWNNSWVPQVLLGKSSGNYNTLICLLPGVNTANNLVRAQRSWETIMSDDSIKTCTQYLTQNYPFCRHSKKNGSFANHRLIIDFNFTLNQQERSSYVFFLLHNTPFLTIWITSDQNMLPLLLWMATSRKQRVSMFVWWGASCTFRKQHTGKKRRCHLS